MVKLFKERETYVTLIGMIFILSLLFLISFLGSSTVLHFLGLSKFNATVFFVSRLLYWISLILLYIYTKVIEKSDFLLWKEKKYKLLMYVASLALIFLVLVICLVPLTIISSHFGLNVRSNRLMEIALILKHNLWLLVFTALTAGIVEELIFRAYLQPRIEIFLKNPYTSILVTSLLFAAIHYRYGTFINVAGPFVIGLVFSFYYWKYRNISVLFVVHFLWDVIGLLLSSNAKAFLF